MRWISITTFPSPLPCALFFYPLLLRSLKLCRNVFLSSLLFSPVLSFYVFLLWCADLYCNVSLLLFNLVLFLFYMFLSCSVDQYYKVSASSYTLCFLFYVLLVFSRFILQRSPLFSLPLLPFHLLLMFSLYIATLPSFLSPMCFIFACFLCSVDLYCNPPFFSLSLVPSFLLASLGLLLHFSILSGFPLHYVLLCNTVLRYVRSPFFVFRNRNIYFIFLLQFHNSVTTLHCHPEGFVEKMFI